MRENDVTLGIPKTSYSEHSSQRAKHVANNVSSYGRDMVQNGLGFMHSVSLKSHGPVLLSMKLLPYPVNQSCFPSALDKLTETTYDAWYQLLRHWRIDCKALFFKTRKWRNRKLVQSQLTFFLSYHKRFHTFSNFDSNKTDDTSV